MVSSGSDYMKFTFVISGPTTQVGDVTYKYPTVDVEVDTSGKSYDEAYAVAKAEAEKLVPSGFRIHVGFVNEPYADVVATFGEEDI